MGYALFITDFVENFHSAPVKSFRVLFGATVFTMTGSTSFKALDEGVVEVFFFLTADFFSTGSVSKKSLWKAIDSWLLVFAT